PGTATTTTSSTGPKTGVSSGTNTGPKCGPHHLIKHKTGWADTRQPDGSLKWLSPGGKTYTTRTDDLDIAPF
ncbi:MAG: hypothetical protein M3021_05080, partial [Actinomycetota bacterium]|nr:hypothetical protein [Actinomycetota bacterium]